MSAKRMTCCECGLKILATMDQAKRHGWTLWVGGGVCEECAGKEPAPVDPIDSVPSAHVVTRCPFADIRGQKACSNHGYSGCGGVVPG